MPEFKMVDVGTIKHYGVKGMKWGVRRKRRRKDRAAKRADNRWAKNVRSRRGYAKAYNAGSRRINKELIPAINAKPKYAADKITANAKLMKEYETEFFKAAEDIIRAEAVKTFGDKSPSGRLKLVTTVGAHGWPSYTVEVDSDHVSHEVVTKVSVEIVRDEFGRIVSFYIPDPELKHHGVKGMKWGVRRKKKRKSTRHMSDEELQRKIKRMSLEKQYRDLHADVRTSRGRKIANQVTGNVMTSQATKAATAIAVAATTYVATKVPDIINAAKQKGLV